MLGDVVFASARPALSAATASTTARTGQRRPGAIGSAFKFELDRKNNSSGFGASVREKFPPTRRTRQAPFRTRHQT